MSSIFLDEIETNATVAALFERSQRLGREIGKLITQPATEDRDFALACNRQALRHTEMALHKINGSLPEPIEPDAIDLAKRYADWTESEKREAFA